MPSESPSTKQVEINDSKDFITSFMSFVDLPNQEAPAIYFRWSIVAMIGAMMGRQVWIPFGASRVFPNQFILLMGAPATKKGTAMKWGQRLLKETGYSRWAPDKCSKEQFVKSMKSFDDDIADIENLSIDTPAESFIFAEEFVDFIGQNDTGFMMMLTKLWDNLSEYKHEKITGKDVVVRKPTVSLFGASTAETFAISFPIESLGTGFMSRVLLVYSESTGKRISWPAIPDPLRQAQLVEALMEMRQLKGEMDLTVESKNLLGDIYQNMVFIEDERFTYYMERRQQHLIKLSMILAISNGRKVIATKDVIRANTMLVSAERRMPMALGEYGASKYSLVSGKLMKFLGAQTRPMSNVELFKVVGKDLDGMPDLVKIMENLKHSEKVQIKTILGKSGWVTKHSETKEWNPRFVDFNWLTPAEY